jgi:hypothetical protein
MLRRSERDVQEPNRLGAGCHFSFRFGEVKGWKACRYCGTWHSLRDTTFSAHQKRMPLEVRHCTGWQSQVARERRVEAGLAPMEPSANACAAHYKNLSRRRKELLRMYGTDAEERMPQGGYDSQEEDDEMDADEAELLALQRELRRIDKYTNRNHLDRRCRLWDREEEWVWASEVDAAANPGELHKLTCEYAESINSAGHAYLQSGRSTFAELQQKLVSCS